MGQDVEMPALPSPWDKIAEMVQVADSRKRAETFEAAVLAYENAADLKRAVYAEIRRMNEPRASAARGKEDKAHAERITAGTPRSPDADLREQILHILEGDQVEGKRPSARMRRLAAGATLVAWMGEHGQFVQSVTGELYYFFRDRRQLFGLDSERWATFLYALSGANPAGTDYAYLASDCRSEATAAECRPVVRLAAWDAKTQTLRVSKFDGSVFVLDGAVVKEEGNGEHVIFNDDPLWTPYAPELDADGSALNWLCGEIPNWDNPLNGLAFRAWVLSAFCSELCPTKPLLTLVGEKGSGKSTLLRLMLRILFGPAAQVGGVPDKPDGFTALAAGAHIVVLDNLDEIVFWLRDKLARVSSGADDTYRKLYSNNEAGRIVYRCWVGITSRNPDTLKRDDLADRMLPLYLGRIEDDTRQAETQLELLTAQFRNQVWGDILTELNAAIALIRAGQMEVRSALRMADWELLGRVFAQVTGHGEEWRKLVERLRGDQSEFLLEGDPLVEALGAWLGNDSNPGRKMLARELYNEWQAALYLDKRPGKEWPGTAQGFSKRLAALRREMTARFDVRWFSGTERYNRSQTVYQFWHKGTQPVQDSLI
jgi:energy-coupling factor transporter ATP-binding protein EcfA2